MENKPKPWEEAATFASSPIAKKETYVPPKSSTPSNGVPIAAPTGKAPWDEAQQAATAVVQPASKPNKKTPPWESKNLDAGWETINKQVRAEQPERDKLRLDLIKNERSQEKDPARIKLLDREIGRLEKGKNG